ncbi:MAG: PD40 domain-containing protein, partial [Acidobacteria bacterium]|nr:PD40 domain-containing protein [Acidobacteriota bacterium]
MKLFVRLSSTLAALILACGAFVSASAQTDSIVGQLTSSTRQSFVNDMNGSGRFAVVESNGDIGTKDPALGLNPDNSDLNSEIFLIDYAQRRIFQITNTKSRLVDTTASTTLLGNIRVVMINTAPMISNDGRHIIFSSNANSLTPSGTNTSTPGNFNANNLTNADRDALLADANQEIWVYELPPFDANVDLSSGAEIPFVDLSAGTFTRITNTPADLLPTAGVTNPPASPTTSDDNRYPTINDDGSVISFVSTRNLTTVPVSSNADLNAEIYLGLRTAPTSYALGQVTNTSGTLVNPVVNTSPMLSGQCLSGSAPCRVRVAYVSNANIPDTGQATGNNSDRNAEIYYTDVDTSALTTVLVNQKQVTRTTRVTPGDIVNVLSTGRRLSRDGNLIVFESTADLTSATPGANATSTTVFLYNVTANTFTKVGARGAEDTTVGGDVLRFPTFSDYVGTSLTPGSIIFVSRLNFKSDGTIPTTASDGLNPDVNRPVQIYAANLPIGMTLTFTRLSRIPSTAFFLASLQPFPSNSRQRISFTLASTELGGGNFDGSPEVYYLLTPAATLSDDNIPESYLTGASLRPVGPAASPTPTPSPSPSPTPTPATPINVPGLSPGMLAVVNFQNRYIIPPQSVAAGAASTTRSPSLPFELGGVSIAVNNAAAGIYSISTRRIVFVVPRGVVPATTGTTYPVMINVRGHILRGSVQLVAAQPDIFTSTNGPGGRAQVINAFNGTPEPFTITTVRPRRPRAPTILRIILTGVDNVAASAITVRIGSQTITGTTAATSPITASALTSMPGFYQIDVTLPAALEGAGDVPVVVTVTVGGQ